MNKDVSPAAQKPEVNRCESCGRPGPTEQTWTSLTVSIQACRGCAREINNLKVKF